MESLNMSKLNLSSVRNTVPGDNAPKQDISEPKYELNSFTDPDDEYHCEYREDIWKSLLEQDAEKPIIHLQSPQLEFRGSLVQQLRDVTKKLGLTIATLHSAVAQLDLFMDAHRLRADRLTHVALACLSLAAKSEEKFSRAPTLKTLAKVSGIQLCGKTFRQLEWMVGQHVRWRLLTPTPVTFAALLAQYVVADCDLTTRHPKFVRRFRRDGAKLLEAYLDLTLSDVRLKVVESVEVGCACVACARAALGLRAWPAWLAAAAGRAPHAIAPIASLLQRMMQILKSRETENEDTYSSSRTSPNATPPYETYRSDVSCRPRHVPESYPVRSDFTINFDENILNQYIPEQKIYSKSTRLIDAMNSVPSTSMGVKRTLESNDRMLDIDRKRYRLANQMSQVVL